MKIGWLALPPALALAAIGCGTNVDLGGAPDAGVSDSSPATTDSSVPVHIDDTCQPCTTTVNCNSTSVCAVYAGDTYCAQVCPDGGGCDPDNQCSGVGTFDDGGAVQGCLPNTGLCKPAVGPVDAGVPATKCGALVGPTVTANCHSCGKFSNDCQANGCYGGYWCDTGSNDCQSPPKSCN